MVWRVVPGFEAYEISSTGQVRRQDTGYQLSRLGRKRDRVQLVRDGMRQNLRVKDLLEAAFTASGPDTPAPDAAVLPCSSEKDVVRQLQGRVTDLGIGESRLNQVLQEQDALVADLRERIQAAGIQARHLRQGLAWWRARARRQARRLEVVQADNSEMAAQLSLVGVTF